MLYELTERGTRTTHSGHGQRGRRVGSLQLHEVAAPSSTAKVGSAEYLRPRPAGEAALEWASLGYMAVEGIVAMVAGIAAGSVPRIGFGLDSAMEGFASVVMVWRFTGWRTLSHHAEERAQKPSAMQFFLLAPYVAVGCGSGRSSTAHHPDESLVGIAASRLEPRPGALARDGPSSASGHA